jgi:hypothetical protein
MSEVSKRFKGEVAIKIGNPKKLTPSAWSKVTAPLPKVVEITPNGVLDDQSEVPPSIVPEVIEVTPNGVLDDHNNGEITPNGVLEVVEETIAPHSGDPQSHGLNEITDKIADIDEGSIKRISLSIINVFKGVISLEPITKRTWVKDFLEKIAVRYMLKEGELNRLNDVLRNNLNVVFDNIIEEFGEKRIRRAKFIRCANTQYERKLNGTLIHFILVRSCDLPEPPASHK